MLDQSTSSTTPNRSYYPPSLDVWFKDIPRLSKTIAGVLGFFLFLGVFFPNYTAPYFTLNAARVGPPEFKLWTLFTAGLYSFSLLGGIVNIILLMIFGKQFEPIWGSTEFIKFISIVNIFSGLSVFFYHIFYYSISNDPFILYQANSCGFSGVIAGFMVALKQLFPEQVIPIFFNITIRAKHLPSVYVLITLIFMLIGLGSKSSTFIIFGTVVSWVYLRFYQRKGRENIKGDRNESFSFATFFPEPLQPLIKIFSNTIFKILCKLQLCNNMSTLSSSFESGDNDDHVLPTHFTPSSYDNANNNNNLTTTTDPISTSTADNDRRRALAMKALEERMQLNQNINTNNNNNNNSSNNSNTTTQQI